MSSECLNTDYTKSTELTETELRILQQYQGLARRLLRLSEIISQISSIPTLELLENLRKIEGKISLVYTLFNAAVYSLFLQRDNEAKLLQQSNHHHNNDQDDHIQRNDDAIQESTQSFIS
ncbi:hypothetical protein WICPIJ_005292 [Wickerhamomyces pijperi]|uniref:DASH complex subunit DAD3 n=1 Tax=Wickerhamomyces pijperi TaxID=599730 RepID=A0A9P8TLY6_WICPI|nr:hypothetical protein WICPIJ_005292 [Wickerhamomyces pijperi]